MDKTNTGYKEALLCFIMFLRPMVASPTDFEGEDERRGSQLFAIHEPHHLMPLNDTTLHSHVGCPWQTRTLQKNEDATAQNGREAMNDLGRCSVPISMCTVQGKRRICDVNMILELLLQKSVFHAPVLIFTLQNMLER